MWSMNTSDARMICAKAQRKQACFFLLFSSLYSEASVVMVGLSFPNMIWCFGVNLQRSTWNSFQRILQAAPAQTNNTRETKGIYLLTAQLVTLIKRNAERNLRFTQVKAGIHRCRHEEKEAKGMRTKGKHTSPLNAGNSSWAFEFHHHASFPEDYWWNDFRSHPCGTVSIKLFSDQHVTADRYDSLG